MVQKRCGGGDWDGVSGWGGGVQERSKGTIVRGRESLTETFCKLSLGLEDQVNILSTPDPPPPNRPS